MKKGKDYIIVKFISNDGTKIYKHYKHPVTGTLANSGKKELISFHKN